MVLTIDMKHVVVTISSGFDGCLLVPLPNNSKFQINELYFKPGNNTDLVMIIMIKHGVNISNYESITY